VSVASNCTGASDKVAITAAWRASRRPGTGQQRRARRLGLQSRAQAYVFNVFGWLAEAARGSYLSLRRVMAGPVLAMHVFGQIYSIHFEPGPPCQNKRSRRRNRKPN